MNKLRKNQENNPIHNSLRKDTYQTLFRKAGEERRA
jgi:hypothetical protein